MSVFPKTKFRSPWARENKRKGSLVQFASIGVISVIAGTAIGLMPDMPSTQNHSSYTGVLNGPAHVVDGDTIRLAGERIRLNGIDAPESDQTCFNDQTESYACGTEAGAYLKSLVGSQSLRCKGKERDRYGRLIATCYLKDRDLNAEMVRAGWAVAYRRFSTKYAPDETAAKTAGLGLWQGSFRMPWAWRRDQSVATVVAHEGTDCNIKGNISENGRIYHIPGSRWYSATRINENNGERWFCSELEALAAGWRSPRHD
ncbi:thermonuclease family protein [Sneathiella sp. HT1-7]|uniref:thermonuclease family protein n=1 Tax=Sneathiella sp. HT1-7 TaxID=2887192 RepID=UPI001D154E3E|nr:thermonuclease family protein [Sneathiella sp. HT1-7]MCC3305667.1 thermonuclease family protein [Sneathiella sp. HT1-7]